jgi:predicted cation transporter
MIWQDILIGSAQAMLAIGLLPALLHHHKPPLSTSAVTALGMAAFVVAFAALGLWWATVMSAVQLVLWVILAVQKWRMTANRE